MKVLDERSINIRVAFLYAKGFDRELFMVPPRDVKNEDNLEIKKPLYDASRKIWLKVREAFDETGIMR